MMRAVWLPLLYAFSRWYHPVRASHAAFVAFDGERVAVVGGGGGGERVAVSVHVGEGDVGDVSALENFRVFFRRAVLVEGCRVGGVHGWFLLFLVCWLLCPRWWVGCAWC